MLFKTRSILQLTIAGFLIVAALLLLALVVTARQLDQLSEYSQLTTSRAAVIMRTSRQLIEHTGAMERFARQYLVLDDQALLDEYANRRLDFLSALQRMREVDLGEAFTEHSDALVNREQQAFHALLSDDNEQMGSSSDYPPLLETAYEISRLTGAWVDDQVAQLREQTRSTQQTLNLQTFFLVCAALIVAALFVNLITRPLKQIDRAINQLGRGTYQPDIQVKGPRDLQLLGERLDWLRSRLHQLEQQRSSFLRHVSHELKTPLAAMQESAALLSEGVTGPLNRQQQEILVILSKNCQRLLRLIEDLLRHHERSFSVIEGLPEPFRLDQVIEDVLSTHQLAIQSGNLGVEKDVESLTMTGDKEKARVIVDNLISNAVKYSPQDGLIHISLHQHKDRAILQIADDGAGIPEADREKIFTPFFQGDVSPKEHYKGSGLGLAIAKEYAEAGGGDIELVPSHKGASFRVTLPLTQEHESNKQLQ